MSRKPSERSWLQTVIAVQYVNWFYVSELFLPSFAPSEEWGWCRNYLLSIFKEGKKNKNTNIHAFVAVLTPWKALQVTSMSVFTSWSRHRKSRNASSIETVSICHGDRVIDAFWLHQVDLDVYTAQSSRNTALLFLIKALPFRDYQDGSKSGSLSLYWKMIAKRKLFVGYWIGWLSFRLVIIWLVCNLLLFYVVRLDK